MHKGRPNVYSYQDVAEAMVVHELVRRNVRFPIIKQAIDLARNQNGSGWPLSNAQSSVPMGGSTVVFYDGMPQDVRNRHGVGQEFDSPLGLRGDIEQGKRGSNVAASDSK